MPGLRGSNRIPGGNARVRRNANSNATAYGSRSLGSGVILDSSRRLTVSVVAGDGLILGESGLSILLDPDGDNKLSLSAAGLAANLTGGDGINFAAQEISVNLTDNTIMAKVGAAAAGPLSIPADNMLIATAAGVLATKLLTANSVIGKIGAADISRISFSINTFLGRGGGVLAAIGIADNSLVGRADGLTLGQIVAAANSLYLRGGIGSDLTNFVVSADSVIGRSGSGDLGQLTFVDNDVLCKPGALVTQTLTIGTNEVFLRAGGSLGGFSMPSGSILVRDLTTPTPDIKALSVPPNNIISVNSAGNWRAQSFTSGQIVRGDVLGGLESAVFSPNRFLRTDSSGNLEDFLALTDWMVVVGAGNVPTFLASAANALVGKFGSGATAFNVIAAESLALRGSGSLASTTIPDSNFVGRPVGGSLGAVTGLQAHAILQGLGVLTLVTKIANYTALATDEVILCDATSGSFTITLPTAVGVQGKKYYIKKIDVGANTITVDADGDELIDGGLTAVLTVPDEAITIVSDAVGWRIL